MRPTCSSVSHAVSISVAELVDLNAMFVVAFSLSAWLFRRALVNSSH
ncbi:MAG: hypothetical protein ACRDKT_14345 [Actinomycetota bacterium]